MTLNSSFNPNTGQWDIKNAVDDIVEVIGTVSAVTTLTRLANTTPYTSGDEVSDIASASAHPFIFAGAARVNNGSGWITKVKLGSSDPLNIGAAYRIFIFDTAPTMVGDNLAYALLNSEFAIRETYIDIGPMITSVGAGGSYIDVDTRKRYVCAVADTKLYGILTIQGAYTPLSAGTFQVELTLERD